MIYLVLVRHGETIWHAENRFAGRSDVPLTPRGHRQAELLGDWARNAELDAIWTSPLGRARETAALAARAARLEPRVDERLRELDFGRGEGLTTAEMEERFPEELHAFGADPVANHLPGGEDPQQAVERGMECLSEIASAHASGRVLVVMHTTLKRLLICHLIGAPLRDYRRLFPFIRNCAITELRLDGEVASVIEFNTPLDPTTAPVIKPGGPRIRA